MNGRRVERSVAATLPSRPFLNVECHAKIDHDMTTIEIEG